MTYAFLPLKLYILYSQFSRFFVSLQSHDNIQNFIGIMEPNSALKPLLEWLRLSAEMEFPDMKF